MLPAALRLCPVPVCDRPVHHELARGGASLELPEYVERGGSESTPKSPYRLECDEAGLLQGRREFDRWLDRRPCEWPDSAHVDGPRKARRGDRAQLRGRFAGHGIPRGQRIPFFAALMALGQGIQIFCVRHGIYTGKTDPEDR